jgi:uncharacterized membrane protein YkoI
MAYSKGLGYEACQQARVFMMVVRLLSLIALCALAAVPADARPRDKEQEAAFRATQQGRFMPLRAIEARILPRMRGADYLGPELDYGMARYRLKFMREGQVIWVDVDARTGQVLGQSGG